MIGSSGEVQSPDPALRDGPIPKSFLLPYCVMLDGLIQLPKMGVQGAEVHAHSCAGLTVLYSTLLSANLSAEQFPRAALEFWDVIRQAFEKGAVIPFRFPTWVSKTKLGEYLKAHAEDYVMFLQQFANYVQIDIRVTPRHTDESSLPASASGTEHMMKLQKRKRWISALPGTFEQIAQIKARSWHHREEGNVLRLFALVERGSAVEFSERLAEFCDLADASIRVSGPWPATEFLP